MPKFYLVSDDVETVECFDYRVRVWRNPSNSVVVVEQLPGSPPPDLYTATLANRITSGQLGFARQHMAWYERSTFEGRDRCFFVSFKRVGRLRSLRPMLMSPAYKRVDWHKVEEVLMDAHGDAIQEEGEEISI